MREVGIFFPLCCPPTRSPPPPFRSVEIPIRIPLNAMMPLITSPVVEDPEK